MKPSVVDRRQGPANSPARDLTTDVSEVVTGDILCEIMTNVGSVQALSKCKAVCRLWRECARLTLCDPDWLADKVSVHDLLKKGEPSPRLVLALTAKRPALVHERDGEGLLPLQYAGVMR